MLNWINIDDRRPDPDKDGKHVLITRKIQLKSGRIFYTTETDIIFKDKEGLIRFGSGNNWTGVTAWMPFPMPYGWKEKENEKQLDH